MIDIRLIRNDYDAVAAALGRRGEDLGPLAEVRELDARVRALQTERDEIRGQVNAISKQVGQLHRDGRADEAAALQEESRALGERERAVDAEVDELGGAIRELLLRIPNLPSPDAPDGASDADNPVVRIVDFDEGGYADHQRVPHWETAAELGILDIERATKLSGAMFTMFRGAGATLARALIQYGLDSNADAFEEVRPPTLVLTDVMVATGQLPKFADDAYTIERDDLWAIPTAEVPLTSLSKDEVLAEADLPMRLMAYTPCYRREAGSAGRDTRGLLRVHEFDKVEIFSYATPEQAPGMLDELVARAEAALAGLGLAYRVLDICTGDMGIAHHRSFDLEVYAPGVDQWLEVSSISWLADYQARRANIRYKPTEGKGNRMLHTLNGSALAVPRVWAAIVETYRQSDGTIAIPEALQPYMRGATVID